MEIKRYLDCYIDTTTCNLRCNYCYISLQHKFSGELYHPVHSPEEIRRALSKERLGGICLINLCAGGETLLSPEVLPIIKELTDEGHYVMVVTNGTVTKHFQLIRDTFSEEQKKRIFFKFSFHYAELKRLNMMNQYFDNIRMMRNEGCSFTCELTTSDDLIDEIPMIKKKVKEKLGAYCHVTIARDDRTDGIDHLSKLDWEEYKTTWKTFRSKLFAFKSHIFYKRRKDFCYAGDWTLYVNLSTGDYSACNCGRRQGNIYTDKRLNFKAIGCCELPHCYNGHTWIVLGAIPRFTQITYADERDRVDQNGNHWLTPDFQDVFSSKLERSNREYPLLKKLMIIVEAKVSILVIKSVRFIKNSMR